MCGIAGVCNIDTLMPISIDKFKVMVSAIKHRGPDEFGMYIDDSVCLGSARLSIIDLDNGIQPIFNEDKSLWIIFNGEIFNYKELKSILAGKNHKFSTATDTEVILHLYEEKGPKCLEDLNGQFSFAIWDSKKKELFTARDRVGIIPFFYTVYNRQFIFASEIKSIIAYSGIEPTIDLKGLEQTFTFWSTIAPQTIFKNIFELRPGHFLKIASGTIHEQKYWDVPLGSVSDNTESTLEESVEQLSDLLQDAIKIRLQADVPVGSYLSGGLDSSGLTASIKKNYNNDLRTFGIRFEEKKFDEGDYQNEMVSFLGTNHSEYFALNKLIGEELPNIIWQVEKPLLRLAPVPLFFLSKLVRNSNYKVVITGEGADEIFGGYDIFKETKIREFWSRRPDSKFRPLLISKLYPDILNNPGLSKILKTFFSSGINEPEHPLFSHQIRWNNTSRIKNFYSDEVRNAIADYDVFEELQKELPNNYSNLDYISKAQYLEIKTFLSSYLLSSQGDRVAMANSVEMRVPYLDHRLIDFMGKIPSKWKIQGMNEKYLLKKVYKDILPKNILNRVKHPYRAPIKQSLVNNNLPYYNELLTENKIKDLGFFDFSKVKILMKKLEKNNVASEVDSMALCGILTTQILNEKLINYKSNLLSNNISFNLVIDKRSMLQNKDFN